MKRLGVVVGLGVTGILLVSAPRSLTAQMRGFVQIGPGLAIPVGDYKNFVKTGWLAQVAGGIATDGIIGGRVSGSFMRNGIKNSDEHVRIIGAMGDLLVSPKMTGNIAPYLLGGVGFQNRKSSAPLSEGETKFAWNAGAGLGLRAGSVGLFVEARYLSISTAGNNTKLIPISAGIRLGGGS